MKKLFVLFMTFALLMHPLALAAEHDVEPGITPDSPLWGLEVAVDNIALALSSKDRKVEKGLEIANERLQELNDVAKKGNVKAATKAKLKYDAVLTKVEAQIETESEASLESLEAELAAEEAIQAHRETAKKIKFELEGALTDEQIKATLAELLAGIDLTSGEFELKIKTKNDQTKIELKMKSPDMADDIDSLDYKYKAAKEILKAEEEIAKAEEKISEFNAEEAQRSVKESNSGKKLENSLTGLASGSGGSDNDDDSESEDTDQEDAREENDDADGSNDTEDSKDDEERSGSGRDDDADENDSDDADDSADEEEDETDEEDVDDVEDEEDEVEEVEFEANDSALFAKYGMTFPENLARSVSSSLSLVDMAKTHVAEAKAALEAGKYEEAYAHAKFARKLANKARSGKYLREKKVGDDDKDESDDASEEDDSEDDDDSEEDKDSDDEEDSDEEDSDDK